MDWAELDYQEVHFPFGRNRFDAFHLYFLGKGPVGPVGPLGAPGAPGNRGTEGLPGNRQI